MAPRSNNSAKSFIIKKILERNNRRRRFFESFAIALSRRRQLIQACLLIVTLLTSQNKKECIRSCRRLPRNSGWWDRVWHIYSDERFKRTFRVSRKTFNFILSRIRNKLERETVSEDPISPELRLGLCLYRLGRGDYFYTIAELTGLGRSTVSTIVREVNEAIVSCMWDECVTAYMPKTHDDFTSKILDMEELWQFPFSWAAVDGCHIPIKCPAGGLEACKEYHNFKNFYSVILMSMVDAKYRFLWGSCGYPGNSHDSIILQSTNLWDEIQGGNLLPNFSQIEQNVSIPPIVLGDSAFPFETWLMKPFTNAVRTPKQRYFNYRLSRARMIVEGAYGQLKGRWRYLTRKSESSPFEAKIATLACMVLHNACLENGDTIPKKLDLTVDPTSNQKRDRTTIQKILLMTRSSGTADVTKTQATKVRNVIMEKVWEEKQNM